MPRQVFTAGSVLTAAQMNIISDATVMTFAGTAARGSAIPTPSEGMVSYLEDSNSLELYTTAWTSLNPETTQVVNEQSGTAYSLVAGDEDTLIRFTAASAITFTVDDVFPIGGRAEFVQSGAGELTFTAGAGVTIQAYGTATKLAGQHAWAAVVCLGTGIYGVVGNIVA